MVPRLLLADQTLEALRRFDEIMPAHDVLLAASKTSDPTVRLARGREGADEIDGFLAAAEHGQPRFRLLLSTLNSLHKVGAALRRQPVRLVEDH